MATLTIGQHISKLRKQAEEIEKQNIPLFFAATEGVRLLVKRIFEDGQDSKGNKIGRYSTKPIYVNPQESPKGFAIRGKTGESVFKSGKPHKTRYFERGYRQFRRTIQREADFVNLRLSNDLQSNIANVITPVGNATIPANQVKPIRVSVDEYVVRLRDENRRKAEGIERKYNKKIFTHSKQEEEEILKVAEFEIFKILNA